MNYEILLAFTLASAALALSPGPDNLFVLTQSMAHGKKNGLATTAGLVAGCLVHTALLAFGVSAIIAENDSIFFYIKLFGAIYLFYLAFKVLMKGSSIELSDAASGNSLSQLFRQGFIMNVLNPKVTIFFLAFFPGFLFSQQLSHVLQFFVLGGIFMGVTFIVFGIIALLSGQVSMALKKYESIGLILKWLQILVFVGIGVYLLLSDK
ncbi:MAG: LysE family translocator [Flavobacteriaceae bacterium]